MTMIIEETCVNENEDSVRKEARTAVVFLFRLFLLASFIFIEFLSNRIDRR